MLKQDVINHATSIQNGALEVLVYGLSKIKKEKSAADADKAIDSLRVAFKAIDILNPPSEDELVKDGILAVLNASANLSRLEIFRAVVVMLEEFYDLFSGRPDVPKIMQQIQIIKEAKRKAKADRKFTIDPAFDNTEELLVNGMVKVLNYGLSKIKDQAGKEVADQLMDVFSEKLKALDVKNNTTTEEDLFKAIFGITSGIAGLVNNKTVSDIEKVLQQIVTLFMKNKSGVIDFIKNLTLLGKLNKSAKVLKK